MKFAPLSIQKLIPSRLLPLESIRTRLTAFVMIFNNCSPVRPKSLRSEAAFSESYELLWQFFHLVAGLGNHSLAENETLRLALERSTECALIAPKPFKPFREYNFFYRFQDFELREWSVNAPTYAFERSFLAGDLDHFVRQWQLLGLIEMLFTIIRRERPEETIRWLDLGCSRGFVANGVRLEDCLPDGNWEIFGVDSNKASVRIANKRAGARRTFLVGDAQGGDTPDRRQKDSTLYPPSNSSSILKIRSKR